MTTDTSEKEHKRILWKPTLRKREKAITRRSLHNDAA